MASTPFNARLGITVGNVSTPVIDNLANISAASISLSTPAPVSSGGTGTNTLTGLIKGSGTSAFVAAVAGTDYVSPSVATSFTIKQSFPAASASITGSLNIPSTSTGNTPLSGDLFGNGTGLQWHNGTALKQLAYADGSNSTGNWVSATTSINLTGGAAGSIPYQSGVGATGFIAAGATGQYLLSQGASAPIWTTLSTVTVGKASNIVGGTAGVIPFQSAIDTTSFSAVGTTGQVLVSGGTGSPIWATSITLGTITASAGLISSGFASNGLNITTVGGATTTWYSSGWYNDGVKMRMVVSASQASQSAAIAAAPNTLRPITLDLASGSLAFDASGAGATFGGAVTAPSFIGSLNGNANTATNSTNATNATNSTNSINLNNGVAGSIPYQSGVGATAFTGAGSAGNILLSGGAGSPTWSTLALSSYANLNVTQTFTKAQAGSILGVTFITTTTLDFSLSNNFSSTLTLNSTLAAPTNLVAGQSGMIVLTQDATGGRTMSFAATWKFASGVVPILSTAANAIDYLTYFVESSSRVYASIIKDVK